MPLFPVNLIDKISDYFYAVDCRVRADLANDYVVGERDYLSRLITLLEYPYGIMGEGRLHFKTMFFSNTLPGAMEQQYGCDTVFAFKNRNRIKLLFVEGKYPRLHLENYMWDYIQRRRRRPAGSHFTSQLTRQRTLINTGIPVLEMFILGEAPLATGAFDLYGSSFVEHGLAFEYQRINIPQGRRWNQGDVYELLFLQQSLTEELNIKYFIRSLLECRLGQAFKLPGNIPSLRIKTKKKNIDFPIPVHSDFVAKLFRDADEKKGLLRKESTFEKKVTLFMKENGIRHLGYIEPH